MSNDKPFRAKNGIVAKRFLQKAGTISSNTDNYRLDKLNITNNFFSTNGINHSPRQVFFSGDGLTMILSAREPDTRILTQSLDFFQFTLTSPYDISTATLTYRNNVAAVAAAHDLTGNVETDLTTSFWKPDGTAFWYIGLDFKTLFQVDVAEAWQLIDSQGNSNISHANKDLIISPNPGDPSIWGVWFKPDGTKLYVLDDISNTYQIKEYNLNPAWDASSATLSSTFTNWDDGLHTYRAMWISPDGFELWVSDSYGTNDAIERYKFVVPWDLSTLYFDADFSNGLNNTSSAIFGLTVTPNGDKLFMVDNDINMIYEASIASNIRSPNLSKGTVFKHSPPDGVEISFSNPPEKGKACAFTLELDAGSTTSGYNLNSSTPASDGFALDLQSAPQSPINVNGPMSIRFKPDGTRAWVLDEHTTDGIWQYDLSTPWDLSTAVQDSNRFTWTNDIPRDIWFKPDGTQFYVLTSQNYIYYATLNTPWDITGTVSPISASALIAFAGFEAFWFNDEGTLLFIVSDDRKIRNFYLSTPWDLSTVDPIGDQPNLTAVTPRGLAFNPDGTEFFVADDNSVRHMEWYRLGAPWDINSATLQEDLYYGFNSFNVRCFTFKPDGTKLYLVDDNQYFVEEIDTSVQTPSTVEWADNIKWEGGVVPLAPALGEKSSYAFMTIDGGVTYYGKEISGELS